jgi:hypothetical protein
MHRMDEDAEDIRDEDLLLRRITPSQHILELPDGTRALNSFAFRDPKNEFSMYVAAEITREKLLSCGFPNQEIIEIQAGDVRRLGYMIIRDPDDCDASHVFAKAIVPKSRSQIHKDCKMLAEIVNQKPDMK